MGVRVADVEDPMPVPPRKATWTGWRGVGSGEEGVAGAGGSRVGAEDLQDWVTRSLGSP